MMEQQTNTPRRRRLRIRFPLRLAVWVVLLAAVAALVGAGLNLGSLSIEDGTIGTVRRLQSAVDDTFGDADETDLSILYLCTHGVLSSSDDGQVYLMLGDGENEAPLGAAALQNILSGIQGEKLLIVDACYSGALIGRGAFAHRDRKSVV